MKTLLLDKTNWDLTVDALGNIAVGDPDYSIAQDVASAIRLFAGELWYDTTQGIPYFTSVLGKPPDVGFLQARFTAAALAVPDVASVTCSIDNLTKTRELTGKVNLTMTSGATATVTASTELPWYVQAISPGANQSGPLLNNDGSVLLDSNGNLIYP